MVKVSFVVPVYNAEEFLPRCIECILNQTLSDIEIICINDCSTDNSLSILNQYEEKDNRIKVLSNPQNQGQSVARNRGIKEAIGEYIMFVDSDDYIHPQSAEIMYTIATTHNAPVVATTKANYLSKHPNKGNALYNINNIKLKAHSNPLRSLLKNNFLNSVVWNKIYQTKLIKDKPFIEGIYFEDWPWTTCLFSELDNFITIDIPLYSYNNLNTSTMRSPFTIKKVKDYATGIEFVHSYFSKDDKKHLWPLVRKHRISQSIKMMINKTYKENKKNNNINIKLYETLLERVSTLHKKQLFSFRDLSVRPLIRYAIIKSL